MHRKCRGLDRGNKERKEENRKRRAILAEASEYLEIDSTFLRERCEDLKLPLRVKEVRKSLEERSKLHTRNARTFASEYAERGGRIRV